MSDETEDDFTHYFNATGRLSAENATLRAERDAAREEVGRLREALRFQDPRNATERYERIADDFYRETHLWPPGRSRAAAMGPAYSSDEEEKNVQRDWRVFVDRWHERFFERALSLATVPMPEEDGLTVESLDVPPKCEVCGRERNHD